MKANPTTDQMKRGEFLRSMGLSSAALMSFYCLGTTMTACSKASDPAPVAPGTGTGTTPGTTTGATGNSETSKGTIDFTLDLTNASYSKLKTPGEFVKIGDVLVANASGGKYVAIQRLCTHQGFQFDQVSYRLSSNDFGCSGHGSVYATDGSVKVAAGGASQPAMKLYKTTPSADGNKLQVTQ